MPHFESKSQVEEHIRHIGLPASIARPVLFIDNFVKPSMRTVLFALLRSYVPEAKPLQMIAIEDANNWVAHALPPGCLHRQGLGGRRRRADPRAHRCHLQAPRLVGVTAVPVAQAAAPAFL